MSEDRCERRIIHEDRLAAARLALSGLPPAALVCDLFKALADPGRLTIVSALAVQEMCVCDLAALLGVSESATSHQLRILRIANLVKNRRDGQVLYYRLADDHVMQLVETATEHAREAVTGGGALT
ncbi:ArsR/SmtB family transcription factor [Desulfofustis glycolicus]|uniref:Transcriptional regulator, ArsR family n=1 Tax=Desulfofustis glycolicus DSM 9705 TaxID=1121409 RepID=A0A1M5YK93_9BACT|nr:metalloregulator ArsR/SmtB family transcription factor [Desulfofustis glycolicus]MCB2217952.1 metalloregulator ArsR/SmtB family transcription factor [Desulfobulbaceae bacterium]SHI12319.1 transcriptional regulator, ArsR family [Desulfofustis glycolicus DSM 9705]